MFLWTLIPKFFQLWSHRHILIIEFLILVVLIVVQWLPFVIAFNHVSKFSLRGLFTHLFHKFS